MSDSNQPVSLGCGTLILIALIVLIFSCGQPTTHAAGSSEIVTLEESSTTPELCAFLGIEAGDEGYEFIRQRLRTMMTNIQLKSEQY